MFPSTRASQSTLSFTGKQAQHLIIMRGCDFAADNAVYVLLLKILLVLTIFFGF